MSIKSHVILILVYIMVSHENSCTDVSTRTIQDDKSSKNAERRPRRQTSTNINQNQLMVQVEHLFKYLPWSVFVLFVQHVYCVRSDDMCTG